MFIKENIITNDKHVNTNKTKKKMVKKKNQSKDPCPLPYLAGGGRRVVLALPALRTVGQVLTVHSCDSTFHPPRPALVEETSTAAASGVSCWVSLFEGQELPARLLSPAHDNNSDRGKIPLADDRKKKRDNFWIKVVQTWIYVSREGPTVGLNGAVVRLVTAQVYLANQQTPGEWKKKKKTIDREVGFSVFSATVEEKKKVERHLLLGVASKLHTVKLFVNKNSYYKRTWEWLACGGEQLVAT